jgi:lipopolysaccharide/colanic/teichoic acid biosynthesis glycosyltransferase
VIDCISNTPEVSLDFEHLNDVTCIVKDMPLYYYIIKRGFDIVVSTSALIILLPLIVITAIFIKAEDGGPIFYVSTRVGTNMSRFRFYKFRSMTTDADSKLSILLPFNDLGEGPRFKMQNDPRITRVGRIIRLLSIDELPQLWNVIKGDMSLVGPRPHSVYEVEKYDETALLRFLVKSGVVCYSECFGRSNLPYQKSIEMDLRYLRERGFRTDLKILFMAVGSLLRHDGAR